MQSCEGDLYFVSIFMLLLLQIVTFCACVLIVYIFNSSHMYTVDCSEY